MRCAWFSFGLEDLLCLCSCVHVCTHALALVPPPASQLQGSGVSEEAIGSLVDDFFKQAPTAATDGATADGATAAASE